jgi:hypothetical protein
MADIKDITGQAYDPEKRAAELRCLAEDWGNMAQYVHAISRTLSLAADGNPLTDAHRGELQASHEFVRAFVAVHDKELEALFLRAERYRAFEFASLFDNPPSASA